MWRNAFTLGVTATMTGQFWLLLLFLARWLFTRLAIISKSFSAAMLRLTMMLLMLLMLIFITIVDKKVPDKSRW
ncbi:hypothetical protein ABIC12_002957 [Pantoea agglomerans]|uniref:hypothetical protein n=1 Tax=Enterobacter agglomerans TaxID=549 RepID=UPI003396B5E2